MAMNDYLQQMAARNASDLFLSVGAPPTIKIEGETIAYGGSPLDSATVTSLTESVLNDEQKRAFAVEREMNLTVARPGVGRFRMNFYRQRGEPAIAVRYVPDRIPSLDTLNLPPILKQLIMLPRGLVLVVGASGSGKSTTLAAMIDYRNRLRAGHILTIEDPIEYLHRHEKSIVDQREVGPDTNSVAAAMQNAIREAPDVIMIGEIRDRATMEQAIIYAETGQLCLATLHANNASQALDRIINFFPDSARKQVLLDLSLNLKAVISQRLLRNANGGRRVPAVELLLQTTHVSDLILKGEIYQLKEAMKQGLDSGMLTFEDSLLRLYNEGRITIEEALDNADSRTDLALRVRLNEPLTLAEKQTDGMALDPNSGKAKTQAADAGWIDEHQRARRL